jgi:hypothetical protein|tara:strand:- start:2009 stop:2494 length:486 start_codon:yes stop_codon:yes gene_type:complete
MAYKGKFKPKNTKKYEGDPTTIIYRSLWERQCFRWCDDNKDVKSWSSEEVVIPYLYEVDKKYHRYYMDLKITYNNGKTVLVEVKPDAQTRPPTGQRRTKRYITEGYTYVKNMNKWGAAMEYALDRGWTFEIWTEKTLSKMGILPKSTKPLKPFKPFKKKTK